MPAPQSTNLTQNESSVNLGIVHLGEGRVRIPRVSYPMLEEDLAPEDRGFNNPSTTPAPENMLFKGFSDYPNVDERARRKTPEELEQILADPEANDMRADLFGERIGEIRGEVENARRGIIGAIETRIPALRTEVAMLFINNHNSPELAKRALMHNGMNEGEATALANQLFEEYQSSQVK